MYEKFEISKEIEELALQVEKEIEPEFKKVEKIAERNSLKVLQAMQNNHLSGMHLNTSTGYGIDEAGRDKIEEIYAEIFKAEDSLVRSQLISGSHALAITLQGLLRPNDIMLSITGLPYDTLQTVIGIGENPGPSSLKSFNIKYEQIELRNNEFDTEKIVERLSKKDIKLVEIQRSIGYSTRKSLCIEKVEQIIKEIRKVNKDVIIMVDNCYCEFVTEKEPIEVGADIAVGSLIKNLGAGIATSGAYVVGKKELISLVADRLTGLGKEIGPSLGQNTNYLKGLFFAPSVVASSLKTMIFASRMLEKLGYNTSPKYNEPRADIVQNIIFNDREKLIKFCQGIQSGSPIDSYVTPVPSPMAGYEDEVIMAAGTFVEGATIELSCDAPLREPYIAYMQGGLTYEYGKLGVLKAIDTLTHWDRFFLSHGTLGPVLFEPWQKYKYNNVKEKFLTRQIRKFSNSKVYHIIIKGNNDSMIFYDDMDRNIFLDRIKLTKENFKYKVYAYCLMSNHVHMVIDVSDENLSKAIQSLTIRYVSYFNKKYGRKGSFVQNRFKSKNIENQRYFLEVCRYVHRNPEKAGIEKTSKYKWSSYSEYIGIEKIIEKKTLMYYLNNNLDEFIKYTNKVENIEEIMNYGDFELSTKLNDDELINIVLKRLNFTSMDEVINFFNRKENIEKVKELKDIKKISKRQLSRIICVNSKIIAKYWNE